MNLLRTLLPLSVAVVEMGEHPVEFDIFPQEEAVVARSVDKRRREFAAVRRCARRALARLGYAPVPILPGERGAPVWPVGVVGSMTHCEGYAAAALAHSDQVATLGVDAEPHGPLPDGVLDLVALPPEAALVARLTAQRPDIHWDRLLFSAKESVYKAWFPLMRTWLGFEQARIEIDPVWQRFSAQLLVPGPTVDGSLLDRFAGRWAVGAGTLVTAISVQRKDASQE